MEQLLLKIAEKMKKDPLVPEVYADYYGISREVMKTDTHLGVSHLVWLSDQLAEVLPGVARVDINAARKLLATHRKTLLAAAPTRSCNLWSGTGNRRRSSICHGARC